MIKRNHPVREAFAGRTSRNSYYETKGHAVSAFDAELAVYDLYLDRNNLSDFTGDAGRKNIDIFDEDDVCNGSAVLSWYRMPSGRYEFTGYIA